LAIGNHVAKLAQHFIYLLTVEGDNHPFYVGKGTYKTRPYAHITRARRGEKSLKASIIRKADRLGRKIRIDVVFSTRDEQVAFAKECELIATFGRRNIDANGVLANITSGGEGSCGVICTDEERQRRSARMKGKIRTLAHCRALSLARMGHVVTKETREKLSLAQTGKQLSASQREKISQRLLGRPVSLATRQKLSKSLKGRVVTEEQRVAIRAALLGRYRPEAEVDANSKTSRADAAHHIRQQRACGLSQKAYCVLHGIKEQTFCGWKRSPYVKERLEEIA
jgi:hypothetical protein